MSNVKLFVLMAGLTTLFVALGGTVGGAQGAATAFVLAAASNFFMYFNSASMVLRAYGARPLAPADAPELHAVVDRLRQRAGLPMPALAVAPHQQPNAFATGRNASNAVVCVTQGLLDVVDRDEIEGVLGHELGHVRSIDLQYLRAVPVRTGRLFEGRKGPEAGVSHQSRHHRCPVCAEGGSGEA